MNSVTALSDTAENSPVTPAPSRRSLVQIGLLVAATAVIAAIVSAVTGEKLIFLYKEELHLSVNSVANLNLILGLPGYAQSLMGAGSDVFPLFGYHRRSYYLLSALVGSLGYLGLSTLHRFPYGTVVCLLMVTAAGYTLLWVIINAVMVTIGNRTGTFGRLQSLSMFVPLVLRIVALSHFGGYVTEHWSYQSAFLTAGMLYLLYLPFVCFLEDRRVSHGSRRAPSAEDLIRIPEDRARRSAVLKRVMRSPGLWSVLSFIVYLQLTPYIDTARTYYQADVLHFSKQFIGDLGSYGSVGVLISLLIFNVMSRRLSARAHIWGAYLGSAAIYVAYMALRDKPTAGLVVIFTGFFINYAYLCIYALGARICPKGAEGTVYGLILTAIGSTYLFSEKFGSFLYDYFGPSNLAHHYTIAHGWYSALWFGLGFTLLAFAFIPFLPSWTRSGRPLASLVIEPENVN